MYTITQYYTKPLHVGPGDRPAPPCGRLAPRCRGVWEAATPPRGGSWRQSPPGSLNDSANRMQCRQCTQCTVYTMHTMYTVYTEYTVHTEYIVRTAYTVYNVYTMYIVYTVYTVYTLHTLYTVYTLYTLYTPTGADTTDSRYVSGRLLFISRPQCLTETADSKSSHKDVTHANIALHETYTHYIKQ